MPRWCMAHKNMIGFVFSIILFWKKSPRESVTEETHLMFQKESIPWKTIERIYVKKSKLGTLYMSIYFRDESAPRSFNLEQIPDKEDLIRYVEAYAPLKGYDFASDIT
ncbi:MAG: hypothetical protein HXS53_00920 [Theionarchaea archaeon]|nr:hypothetical protein [Theionarchaea archaeon]